ncbi:MAG: hypothetical protein U0Q16_06145 [Bryobacteraceae bacterium]
MFLNVDLDIYSRRSLQPLVEALGKKVYVMRHIGREDRGHSAHLELAGRIRNLDETIRRFCALIRGLPAPERKLWDDARKKDFNIGIRAVTDPYSVEYVVSAEAVKAVAELGGRILITVYAPEAE